KFEMIQSLEKYADVYYWYQDGHIKDILKRLKIRPHFIFHYDIAWNYGLAPKIDGLADIDCLKGCFVIDLHWKPEERKRYFRQNKIDLIFSATKHPFLKVFTQYKQKKTALATLGEQPRHHDRLETEKRYRFLAHGARLYESGEKGASQLASKNSP